MMQLQLFLWQQVRTITETTYTGAETQLSLRISDQVLRMTTINRASSPVGREGENVTITLPPEALIVLED